MQLSRNLNELKLALSLWESNFFSSLFVQCNVKVLSKLTLGEEAHYSLEFNTEVGSLLWNAMITEAPATFSELLSYMRTEVGLDCFGAYNIPYKQKMFSE